MRYAKVVLLLGVAAGLCVVGMLFESIWAFALAIAVAIVALTLFAIASRPRSTYVTEVPESRRVASTASRLRAADTTIVSLDDPRLPSVMVDEYDELTTGETLAALEVLSVEELQSVMARERKLRNRPVVMERAQRLIDLTLGHAAPERELVPGHSRAPRQRGLSI